MSKLEDIFDVDYKLLDNKNNIYCILREHKSYNGFIVIKNTDGKFFCEPIIEFQRYGLISIIDTPIRKFDLETCNCIMITGKGETKLERVRNYNLISPQSFCIVESKKFGNLLKSLTSDMTDLGYNCDECKFEFKTEDYIYFLIKDTEKYKVKNVACFCEKCI